MKSKKRVNTDGSTRLIIVKHDSGSYSSYTPSQAAQMISVSELLREALAQWNKD